jgi:hypothetical protein
VSDPGGFLIEDEGDSRSISGRGFAVVFHRVGDRWTHVIEVERETGGPREPIASAVEWDADRDDPARVVSPVFQELQFQAVSPDRPQALLLGMSGRHHFSAAFVVEIAGEGVTLAVDVADRCRESGVAILASTYTALLHSGELAESDESRIAWDLGGRRLAFAAGDATRVGLAEAGRRATRVQAFAEIAVAGATRRWQYSWSLSPATV